MLSLPPPQRHGYTHEAMCRGEVMQDYVIAVSNDPQTALDRVGIQVRQINRDQFPNSHSFFDHNRYEDFFASVYWVKEVAPREHDATCVTLIMRLRAGRQSSDIFRCGYVLVTRNATFVRESRAYCLQSRLINEIQQGPLIHQRELATVAWLRTGLGADDEIPRGHLLATCERVLRVRPEVTAAVAEKLKQVTPEKLEQYELLLQDYRSLRRLADETLNDEKVVTPENAQQLLEAMRQAAIAEERERFESQLTEQKLLHKKEQRTARADATKAIAARDAALAELAAREAEDHVTVDRMIGETNFAMKWFGRGATALLLLLGLLAITNYLTDWFSQSNAWSVVLGLAGLLGLYHFMAHLLGKPIVGLSGIVNFGCRKLFMRKLARSGILQRTDLSKFKFIIGQVCRESD